MSIIVKETHFQFPGQVGFYKGKVRDVYEVDGKLVMVASDRISAFDHILPQAIPFKGQVLNQIAAKFLKATEDIVPNWVLSVPDPNVTIGHKCEPFQIEMVVRAYLTGHAWRLYRSGERVICGVPMPEGMKENERFPTPIITPATKATSGHDEDISKEEILKRGLATEDDYAQLEAYTLALFERGSKMAEKQGLILVDTKYEFGKIGDTIYLIDEIHTPDSSRYFYLETYEKRQASGEAQKHLSKEFVRQWLIEQGFQGLEGQQMPEMPDAFVNMVSERYIELYEKLTGTHFRKDTSQNAVERIEVNVSNALESLIGVH